MHTFLLCVIFVLGVLFNSRHLPQREHCLAKFLSASGRRSKTNQCQSALTNLERHNEVAEGYTYTL